LDELELLRRLAGECPLLPDTIEKVRNRIAAKIRSSDILSKNRCSMLPEREREKFQELQQQREFQQQQQQLMLQLFGHIMQGIAH
jgi:hypothetical protein